ncbi:MAG TPA: hypothetical protein VJX47_02270 [Candidatus Sulfotelmatobacter sp.]|nr:hypothetical protein [Candidatus Sulfotelmatobacter sp.]
MSARNAIVLLLALSTLLFLAGCGSSSNKSTPPPTGGFTASNFNGTYVFSFSGTDVTSSSTASSASFFAVVGTLSANGSGALTATMDINDPELAAAVNSTTTNVFTGVTGSGNYKVTSDGRGTGTVTVSVNGTSVPLGIDFVLSSNSGGLITRFDQFGTGSGSFDLQASGITQSNLVGSYSFGVNGIDSTGNPLGTVGSITLDASGNATGTEDLNDNGSSSNLTALALASPSALTVGSPSGVLNLTASAGLLSSFTFDAWVIDASHIKLIETDSTAVLAGDAFVSTGQTSFPSGALAFTMSGGNSTIGPFVTGGLLTSDGTSAISSGTEDVNAGGSIANSPSVTGSFTSASGRTELTLSGIYNIVGGTVANNTYSFAAYPYNGGIELLEIDSAGAGDGTLGGAAYPQTSTSLAASQGYGLNLSGANSNGEVDMIAEFSTDSSGGLSGLYDANNEGALVPDESLGSGATYANNSNGRGTISFPNLQTNSNSVLGQIILTFYAVNSSTLVFIETDANGQVASGILEQQSSAGSSSAASPHIAVARPMFHPHVARQKKN